MQTIELLSPARDLTCGMEAIRHGADAVYIGGPDFGARSAAGNSVEDIAALCQYAHLFNARVYVTLNTILWNEELAEAERLVWQLYRAGVDALIVQDLALLQLNLPPIALHASTQMDNCTPEKAQWLEAAGFRQIVVAREMSLQQIRDMATAVKVPIEAFVHGALCVSYSGRCYASQHCFGRSANRGCCAQFCRLAFDLVDGQGRTLVADRHLLSLRDMNRTEQLEEMMDAGVRSFKIEGRLKDAGYVKNVTAWYRQRIDEILKRRADEYVRASQGKSRLTFQPDVQRSFNRGFTDYFLQGRTPQPIYAFHSPKATGPQVGWVKRTERQRFVFEPLSPSTPPLVAGDGLCFVDREGRLEGFRVNRVEGKLVFPAKMPPLRPGTVLHRSLDFAFGQQLTRPTAERTLAARLTLRETPQGYAIDMADETGCHVTLGFVYPHEAARTNQREAIVRQLTKLGGTCWTAQEVEVLTQGERFIPASVLADWRRQVCEALLRDHRLAYQTDRPGKRDEDLLRRLTPQRLDYNANVANDQARAFYQSHGATELAPAFELKEPQGEAVLMTCRHCIRHALGICLKKDRSTPGPLALRLPDGRTFPLRFDCQRCEMQVLKNK
ncbi:U32 family peptidase [bacterium]|nr:U32 family peptidase [bacterium]